MKKRFILLFGSLIILLALAGCSSSNSADVTLFIMAKNGVEEQSLEQIEQWMEKKAGERFTFRAIGEPEYDLDKLTIEVGVGKYELIILPEEDYERIVVQYVFEALDDYVSSVETFEDGIRTIEVTRRLPSIPGTPQTQTEIFTALYGIPLENTVMEQELQLFDENLYLVMIPRLKPPIERVEALQMIAEGKVLE